MVKVMHYIELMGENPLKAVVAGTNANAHLVAGAALAQGVEETAEQYFMSMAQVYGALAFYYENQDEIEQARAEDREKSKQHAMSAKEFAEKLKRRKTQQET